MPYPNCLIPEPHCYLIGSLPPGTPPTRCTTPAVVAEAYSCSRKTIYRAIRSGHIDAVKRPNGTWSIVDQRLDRVNSEIDQAAQEQRERAEAAT